MRGICCSAVFYAVSAVITLSVQTAVVFGDAPTQFASTDAIKVEGTIYDFLEGNLRADVDLGSLRSGEAAPFVVRIHNKSSTALPFEKILANCSCIKATALGNVIPASGHLDIELTLNVPARSSKTTIDQSIILEDSSKAVVEVIVHYELEGLLCFRDKAVLVNIAETEQECTFRVPILFSLPIVPEDISVTHIGKLTDLVASIGSSNGQHYLECTIAMEHAKPYGASGEICITDSKTGRSDSVPCVIELEKNLAISPNVIRFKFKQVDNSNEEVYQASAIIRINASKLTFPRNDRSQPEHEVLINCTPDHGIISIQKKRIAAGIYRVIIECRKSMVETADISNPDEGSNDQSVGISESPSSLQWELNTGREVLSAKSVVKFTNR